jgi:hypothetical protein
MMVRRMIQSTRFEGHKVRQIHATISERRNQISFPKVLTGVTVQVTRDVQSACQVHAITVLYSK